jgi:exodeoxyribonuclease VII small subunit
MNDEQTDAADPTDTFESLYQRLEDVAARLESGNLPLEDSVTLYEEGMRLAQQCQVLLAVVEQRIETLRETYEDGFGR